MGITSRKEREKEEMRRLILDAELRLFREKGYDGVSIRNIAEAIEYTAAYIYLYYKDKRATFFAMQFDAAAVKRDNLLPVAHIENPWERLIEFGRRYIDFGMKHPDLYDLLERHHRGGFVTVRESDYAPAFAVVRRFGAQAAEE